MSNKAPIWTKSFISLFTTNLAIFTVFYGLIATLPLFAIGVLDRTDEEAGLLLSIFLLSAVVVRPFSGKLLDLVGKRKMLWISLVLYTICTFLYFIIPTFGILLVLRFFNGVWFSIATTATGAIAADQIPVTRRGAGLGYFAMSTNLAAVVGPFIGLLIVQYFTFDVLFLFMSVLIVLGGIVSLMTPIDYIQVNQSKSFKFTWSDLIEKKAFPMALLGSLISFSHASVLSYLSIYAQEIGLLGFASFFFVVFAGVMLISRPFTGRLFDEKGPYALLFPGLASFFVGLLCLAFMQRGFTFMVAGVFVGLGYGALVPSLQAMAIQTTARERSGYATATFFTMFDLGIALGSYVLGMVAVYSNYTMVYLVAAIIILVVFIFLTIKKRREAIA